MKTRAAIAVAPNQPLVIEEVDLAGPKDGEVLVEIVATGGSGHAWLLTSEDGSRLAIPLGAAGAERIPDALAALPGIDLGAGVAAVARSGRPPTPVWTRPARAAAGTPPRRIGPH